jgi:hypothetical protein
MTFEQQCIAHYSAIKRRVAWPAKKPIVVQNTGRKLVGRIKCERFETYHQAAPVRLQNRRLIDDQAKLIKAMWDQGEKLYEIAAETGYARASVARWIQKQGWQRP